MTRPLWSLLALDEMLDTGNISGGSTECKEVRMILIWAAANAGQAATVDLLRG